MTGIFKNIKKKDRKFRAKMAGQKLGKPFMALPESFQYLAELYNFGQISATAAAKELGISVSTFLRRLE